ncbi:SDR family oxidoreductase [Teichococcus vastitatis]|uniref:SDR family oxidoreductase n=1 Tax=Teichococcus vastitatis TaxID=2307076 RepID=A0ABS9W5L9_9PROT|nr:SDR family oxidoreductase [Pseudoroseomonas vastitatis]MCI0754587.1 SDR family oxidoreductase [Pseudoroseomonas vastitatis]
MSNTRGGRVVVITGASSGIGRATAYAFAENGDNVVLAARRADRLEELARECELLGVQALAVPTDTTDEAQVQSLADRALQRFGRIDVWFNNAGVGIFGRFEDLPSDAWRRVIETNLFGYVHGARAVMPVFRRQGHGVLIQNASIVGRTAKPDSTAYATSKFAVRGFSEALRQEVLDQPGIQICTILPSVIDTPFFQHAANYSHHRVRAAPPVYTPEKVAHTVLRLVDRPRAETIIGGFGQFASLVKRIAPSPVATRLIGRVLNAGFLARESSPETSGALFAPAADEARVRGGWRHGLNNGGVPMAAFGVLAAVLVLRRLTR